MDVIGYKYCMHTVSIYRDLCIFSAEKEFFYYIVKVVESEQRQYEALRKKRYDWEVRIDESITITEK